MVSGKYAIYLLCFFMSLVVNAQQRQIKKGNQAFDDLAYAEAILYYEEAYLKGDRSKQLHQNIADSYFYMSKFDEAMFWYKKLIIAYSGEINEEYIDRYAYCLMTLNEYKEANMILKHLNSKKSTSTDPDLGYLNDIEDLSGRFSVENFSCNSEYSDYAPCVRGDEVVFSSSRDKGIFIEEIHQWNNEPFLDLYSTKANGTKGVHKLKGKVNSKFHESSATFSKDHNTVYFTRTNYFKGKKGVSEEGYVLLNIYKASFINGKWDDIQKVSFNSDEYSVSHPSLSSDGRYLYFASDMPGGYGDTDLYVVEINDRGEFSKPKNLGSDINTQDKETFPFISDSGRLFFASNGHKGLGGLDIFMAYNGQSGKINVENLGKPINSSLDDFTFVIREEQGTGYFASNRPGGKGGDDIYQFKQLESLPENYPSLRIKKSIMKQVFIPDLNIDSENKITSF